MDLRSVAELLRSAEPEELEAVFELHSHTYPELVVIAMHLRRGGDPATAGIIREYAAARHPERLPISQQRRLPEYLELASEHSGDTLADLRGAAAAREARLALNSAAGAAGLILGRNLSDAERAAGAWLLRYIRHDWITCVAGGLAAALKVAIAVFA